jgi:hypothetical protein
MPYKSTTKKQVNKLKNLQKKIKNIFVKPIYNCPFCYRPWKDEHLAYERCPFCIRELTFLFKADDHFTYDTRPFFLKQATILHNRCISVYLYS